MASEGFQTLFEITFSRRHEHLLTTEHCVEVKSALRVIVTVSADNALHHRLAESHRRCPGDEVDTEAAPELGDGVEDASGHAGGVHAEAGHPEQMVEDETLPEAGAEVSGGQGGGQEADTQGGPGNTRRRLDLGLTQGN